MTFSRSTSRVAFTLVELLVAMAVLALLVILVARLLNSATLTTTGSRKQMDADSQARMILDRIGSDLERMTKRSDVDCFLKGWSADVTMPGNDVLFLFSETIGYFRGASLSARSPVTLVGYRVNPASTPGASAYALERFGQALAWEATPGAESMAFLTYTTGTAAPIPGSTIQGRWPAIVGSPPNYTGGTSADYQAIGEQVFRFEYCYLLKDGTFSKTPFLSPHTRVDGARDIVAIVVGIAILDNASRKIAPDLSLLSAALPDPTDTQLAQTPPVLMAETWRNAMSGSTFADSVGLPQSAVGQVRVYQRFYYLGN